MSNNYYNNSNISNMPERVLSALAYLTFGLVGIILIIVSAIAKVGLKQFVKFNVYQSVLIGVIFGLVQVTYDLIDGILQILQIIPILGKFLYSIFQFIIYYLMGFPLIFGFPLLSSLIICVIIYLAVSCLLGKLPYIPYISNILKRL